MIVKNEGMYETVLQANNTRGNDWLVLLNFSKGYLGQLLFCFSLFFFSLQNCRNYIILWHFDANL